MFRNLVECGDLALSQYLTGARQIVPYLFGEIAFHEPGQAGIELNQVLNIVWVKERTARGVVEAMQQGRFYAVGQYRPGIHLRLDDFHLRCLDHSCVAGMGGNASSRLRTGPVRSCQGLCRPPPSPSHFREAHSIRTGGVARVGQYAITSHISGKTRKILETVLLSCRNKWGQEKS